MCITIASQASWTTLLFFSSHFPLYFASIYYQYFIFLNSFAFLFPPVSTCPCAIAISMTEHILLFFSPNGDFPTNLSKYKEDCNKTKEDFCMSLFLFRKAEILFHFNKIKIILFYPIFQLLFFINCCAAVHFFLSM